MILCARFCVFTEPVSAVTACRVPRLPNHSTNRLSTSARRLSTNQCSWRLSASTWNELPSQHCAYWLPPSAWFDAWEQYCGSRLSSSSRLDAWDLSLAGLSTDSGGWLSTHPASRISRILSAGWWTIRSPLTLRYIYYISDIGASVHYAACNTLKQNCTHF